METLEPSAVNAFKLFYFEGLSEEEIGDVLNMSQKEVCNKLAYVCGELKIDSSMDEESEAKIKELVDIYESAELPEDLEEAVHSAIRREEENFASFMEKYEKNKIRKHLGLLILAAGLFFVTILLGRNNPVFAESVLSYPYSTSCSPRFFKALTLSPAVVYGGGERSCKYD
jgi:predicted DNA-binding protein YlxM (UPF0122 family)